MSSQGPLTDVRGSDVGRFRRRRYINVMFRTDRSAQLHERACRSLATGVSSGIRRHATPVPMYFERGDGPYFFDVDGHKLLDYTLAWGPLIVGSNHPVVNARVAEQLARGYTFGAQHLGEIQLA